MAVFIPDIFSGYLTGMRQANEDNWKDLSNYNSTLNGQMDNAFKMATFDPAVRTAWNQGQISDNNTMLHNLGTDASRRQAVTYMMNNGPEIAGQAKAQAAAFNFGLQPFNYSNSVTAADLYNQYARPMTELNYQQALQNFANGQANNSNNLLVTPGAGSAQGQSTVDNDALKAQTDAIANGTITFGDPASTGLNNNLASGALSNTFNSDGSANVKHPQTANEAMGQGWSSLGSY